MTFLHSLGLEIQFVFLNVILDIISKYLKTKSCQVANVNFVNTLMGSLRRETLWKMNTSV
jgi:hypothetical protein